MAMDLGRGVSLVYDNDKYNYDMVVFQKGKPPLDAELNLAQELQNLISKRNLKNLQSGWITLYPYYADRSLGSKYPNKFFTQNPVGAKPEYALVNGQVIHVTNTGTSMPNVNIIDLGDPPVSGNVVNGVFLEVWRALLDPNTNTTNGVAVKPDPSTVIDTFNDIFMIDENTGWAVGTNGLIIRTTTGGDSWSVIHIDTKYTLNCVHFVNPVIGWVVGDSGLIARSSSGGQTWVILASPTVTNLKSVFAVNQTTVWAVGENGTLLKSGNGVSFTQVNSGVTNNLNSIYFSDANHGWIVGDKGLILTTNNGGVTWNLSLSGTTENLNSVYFYNANFGFAVGNNGTILQSSNGGLSWVSQSNNIIGGSISDNLYDVTMFPKLDEVVVDEEVSSQLGATGTSFTTMHRPITGKDGKGIISNNPADIVVTVNGSPVAVNGINGATGLVILASPPGPGAVTKVSYHYQASCAIFQGQAWIVGSSGRVLHTSDIGSTWTVQDPNLGVITDLKTVSFISQTEGWLAGGLSIIRKTMNSGTTWLAQQSDVFARKVQRVWHEGNNQSPVYLDENTLHPDVQIETTKRVQVQYRIRVVKGVDPNSYPEAGLNSTILGQGPNEAGFFGYENMGPINGDYGCWRAKCPNTVDGYVYAIPMAFVNRRNRQCFNAISNFNGQYCPGASSIRPDLLLATNVVPGDILDVRHKVTISSTEELLYKTFDALSSNTLKTNFVRVSTGGDRYGSELLKVDTIPTSDLADGSYNSQSILIELENRINPVYPLPSPSPFEYSRSGIFSADPSNYKALYKASDATINGKMVPGQFSNLGAITPSTPIFTFNANALDSSTPGLSSYSIYGSFFANSTLGLTYSPSDPQLVINSSGGIYHGVLDSTEGKVFETWDSGISGYQNYSVVYSAKNPMDENQMVRASPVEVHYFIQVSSSNLSGGILSIPNNIVVDSTTVPYSIYTVRRIYNRTSGFFHRIEYIRHDSSVIRIKPAAGYDFINGTILEIIAGVTCNNSNTNVRNGAAVNFSSRLRGLSNFTTSVIATASPPNYEITFGTNSKILGWSTTDTTAGLSKAICWGASTGNMYQVDISRFLDYLGIKLYGPSLESVSIQILLQNDVLNPGVLSAGYNYIPTQCQTLPPSLTIEPLNGPSNLYVSNLGSGGGDKGVYDLPIEHIPVNDPAITSDRIFNNFIHLRLANYFTTGGFLQIPVSVPAGFYGNILVLSSPSMDAMGRTFFKNCSKEIRLEAESLVIRVPRKVYFPILAKVRGDNDLFLNGEYVLVIFSRPVISDTKNVTGFYPDGKCSISVYRLDNRPIG